MVPGMHGQDEHGAWLFVYSVHGALCVFLQMRRRTGVNKTFSRNRTATMWNVIGYASTQNAILALITPAVLWQMNAYA